MKTKILTRAIRMMLAFRSGITAPEFLLLDKRYPYYGYKAGK